VRAPALWDKGYADWPQFALAARAKYASVVLRVIAVAAMLVIDKEGRPRCLRVNGLSAWVVHTFRLANVSWWG